ncbi:MerR family transcriptional regulator [Cohnella silvisoli]|nr:MerR family transcriptional regulator [Cohnella silvisoli]
MLNKKHWKVGELAKLSGLTVRTLRYYDQIKLFSPSHFTDTGHRLYNEEDLVRCQRVMSLKELGFSLDQIKELIESPEFNPEEVIRVQLERLNEAIRIQEQLRVQLENVYRLLRNQQTVSAEDFIQLIEVMRMNADKYFTQEQMDQLHMRSQQLNQNQTQTVQDNWSDLIEALRAKMESGTSPDNPEVIQLAKRWKELIDLFSGGDPEFIRSAEKFHAENPNNPLQFGLDGELYRYINRALS